jgi:D-psicose/D-tagatose/L-ribulose 3-epimerase
MKISLCNEVLEPLSFDDQCKLAKSLGYEGLEIAPFTVSDNPEKLTVREAENFRKIAREEGLVITGLHWLLVKPIGLSITTPNKEIFEKTKNFASKLCELCHAFGGNYLVHGSPKQRQISADQTHADALARAVEFFEYVSDSAKEFKVTYCIEPLSIDQTPIINTLSEAIEIIEKIQSPHLKTMLDTSSAGLTENISIPQLIHQFMPTGHIAHVQLNDPNRRGPGQGDMQFGAILEALRTNNYTGELAIEPFEYLPDGPTCAAQSIGYLKGLFENMK